MRTIIFNTKNHLGRNFGVLIAWTVLSLITVPLMVWFMRKKEIQAEKSAQLENEHDEEIRERQQRADFGAGTTAQLTPELERQVENAEKADRRV